MWVYSVTSRLKEALESLCHNGLPHSSCGQVEAVEAHVPETRHVGCSRVQNPDGSQSKARIQEQEAQGYMQYLTKSTAPLFPWRWLVLLPPTGHWKKLAGPTSGQSTGVERREWRASCLSLWFLCKSSSKSWIATECSGLRIVMDSAWTVMA